MIETLGIKKTHLIIAVSVTSGLVLGIVSTLLLSKSNSNSEPSVTQIEKKLIDEQTLKPEEPNKPEKKLNEEKSTLEVSGTPKEGTPAIGRPGALPVQPRKNNQPRPPMPLPQEIQRGQNVSSTLPLPPLKSEDSLVPPPPPLKSEDSLVPPPPPLESENSSVSPPPPEFRSPMPVQEQQVDKSSQSGLQVPPASPLPEKYSSQSKLSTSVQDQQNSNSDNNPSTLTRNKTKVLSQENTQSKGQSGQPGITRQRSSSLPSLQTNSSTRIILNNTLISLRLKVRESDLSGLQGMDDDDSNNDAVNELKNSQSNDQTRDNGVSNEIETNGSNNRVFNSGTLLNVINQKNGQSLGLSRGNSDSTLATGNNDEDWETEADFVNSNTSDTGVGRINAFDKLNSTSTSVYKVYSGLPESQEVQSELYVQESNQNASSTVKEQDQLLTNPSSLPPRRLRRASCSDLSKLQKEEQSQPQPQSGNVLDRVKFFQSLAQK